MYTETQHATPPYARWIKWLCGVAAAVQLILLIATETGARALPLSTALHWGILIAAGLALGVLAQAGLELRVETQGVSLRFFPYQLRFQRIRWEEIRQLRLLPSGECPEGAPLGLPGRDFTHAYWLTALNCPVLHITLVNGTQLYVSTRRPAELLDFLQHGLQLHGIKTGPGPA